MRYIRIYIIIIIIIIIILLVEQQPTEFLEKSHISSKIYSYTQRNLFNLRRFVWSTNLISQANSYICFSTMFK